ncbi:MAG: hypothetical protein M4579_002017 [Chaenotheca gracillima]|nr:MAG: hypothetical protein M4579_002017 [Chaenotheca gracillima]
MAARRQTTELERRLPESYHKIHVLDRTGNKITKVLNAQIAYTADLEKECNEQEKQIQEQQEHIKQRDLKIHSLQVKNAALERQLNNAEDVENAALERQLNSSEVLHRQADQLRSLVRLIPQQLLQQYTSAGQMPGDALCNYIFELKARAGLLAPFPTVYEEHKIIGNGDEDDNLDETEQAEEPEKNLNGNNGVAHGRVLRSNSQPDSLMSG